MTKTTEKEVIKFEMPKSLQKEITDKVVENMRDQYYWGVTKLISEKLTARMESEDYINQIADLIFEKLKFSEKEFSEKLAEEMKGALLSCVSTISKEVVGKVEEKVKSYGFIKVG